MEVKKIMKTVEEVVGYVAFDGREFKDVDECIKYEATAMSVIKQNFMRLVKRTILEEDLGGGCSAYVGAGESDIYWYALIRIENENDLMAAQMYQTKTHPACKRKFTADDIGHDLIVGIGEEYDCCWVFGEFNECLEQYHKAMNRFYKTEEEEKKERETE